MTKYNHDKAQEIYKKEDPNNKIYENILKKIQNKVMIPSVIQELGVDISCESLKGEELVNKVITVAEATYKALNHDKIANGYGAQYITGKSEDSLFYMVLHELFYGLNEDQFNEVLGNLTKVYDAEI